MYSSNRVLNNPKRSLTTPNDTKVPKKSKRSWPISKDSNRSQDFPNDPKNHKRSKKILIDTKTILKDSKKS